MALAIMVLIGWQMWYPAQMEKARRAQEQLAASTSENSPAVASPASPAATPKPASEGPSNVAAPTTPNPAPSPEAKVEPKRVETLRGVDAEWQFTSLGGGVEKVTLLNHQSEGSAVVMNQFGGIPIGALTEAFENPVLDSYAMEVVGDGKTVVFRRTDARQLEVEKRFTLKASTVGSAALPAPFELDLEVRFANRSAGSLTVPNYAVRLGSSAALHGKDLPIYTGVNRFLGGSAKFTDVNWFSGGGFLGFGKKERPLYSETGSISWAGVTNQYYATIVTPREATVPEVVARRFEIRAEDWIASGRSASSTGPVFAIDAGVKLSSETLAPGQEVIRRFTWFSGPREYRILSAIGGEQEQMLDFGMFSIVSRILLSSMNGLNGLLGSYAAAIMVLTVIIKLLMWPLQNKSTASMKRMQELQPKMNEIKERYGNDPQRMNVEIMGLYKKHGVNPMSGCLPMLIQIPIFFGFYNMLGKAVELRNSSFLWVKDLSQPDTVAMIAGYPLNVLPLIMAATMLWQMQLTPKTGDPVQQRMFMFMPLIFIVFCYNFASALALYWAVQNIFSIVQLTITNAKEKGGAQSTVASPSKWK